MKSEDRRAGGYKIGGAPLPKHWCENNWHQDEGQQCGPTLAGGQGQESAFATICRSFWVPQKSSHPREAPLLSLLTGLVGGPSKSFSVDERFQANSFADAVRDIFDLLFG